MKAILEFNLPEDRSDFDIANKGIDYYLALWDIANDIFRPHRKHGYQNADLENLIQQSEEMSDGELLGNEIISKLEEMFYEILEDRGISLD